MLCHLGQTIRIGGPEPPAVQHALTHSEAWFILILTCGLAAQQVIMANDWTACSLPVLLLIVFVASDHFDGKSDSGG